MPKMIFVNLPVADLARAKAFYEGAGFTNEPKFTDETAACMVFSEAIHVMLLTHEKFMHFSPKPIASRDTCEVLLALSADTRDAVDDMIDKAGAHGGKADAFPKQDYGWMYSRNFEDPDGHIWEVVWMDMEAAVAANLEETAA